MVSGDFYWKTEKNNKMIYVAADCTGHGVPGAMVSVVCNSALNRAVKENLKTYINEYRMLTDGINMNDGFVINIGLEFEIITYPNYNKNEVLTKCISEVKDFFSIDNWQFNQTINLNEIELLLANVEGVMSVPSVKISNICKSDGNENYSPNRYNIDEATKGKIVYPSLDPCIFEVKYPNKDIKGRAL